MKEGMGRFYCRAFLRGTLYQALRLLGEFMGAWFLSRILALAMEARGDDLTRTALLGLGTIAVCAGLRYALGLRWERSAQDGLHSHRKALLRQMMEKALPVETAAEADIRLQRDAETVRAHWTQTLPEMGVSLCFALICVALMARIHGTLALIFGLLSLTQLLPTLVYEKWAKAIYLRVLRDEESYCNWVGEGLRGISTLKAYQQETWFLQRLMRCSEAIIRSGRQETRTAAVQDIVTDLVRTLLEYGSYLILGMAAMTGMATVTQLPFLLVAAQRLFSFIAAVVLDVVRCFGYQKAEERLRAQSASATRRPPEGCVAALEGASKAYAGKTVLQDVSLQVRQGERILLSGANGAGKSTLLRLLLGFCQPEAGEAFPPETAAFVFQEEPDLEATGEEIAREMAQRGAISMEAFRAHCAAFQIEPALRASLAECSQGQRRKFYLSLALARRGGLLVLDEPTNHLDPAAVEYLSAQLDAYAGTLLLCTHDARFAAAAGINRHFKLEGGHVYEEVP